MYLKLLGFELCYGWLDHYYALAIGIGFWDQCAEFILNLGELKPLPLCLTYDETLSNRFLIDREIIESMKQKAKAVGGKKSSGIFLFFGSLIFPEKAPNFYREVGWVITQFFSVDFTRRQKLVELPELLLTRLKTTYQSEIWTIFATLFPWDSGFRAMSGQTEQLLIRRLRALGYHNATTFNFNGTSFSKMKQCCNTLISNIFNFIIYNLWNFFLSADKSQFRHSVIWLEDQKIRFYHMDQRKGLRELESDNWDKAYQDYLDKLKCPQDLYSSKKMQYAWLLGHAIKTTYLQERKSSGRALMCQMFWWCYILKSFVFPLSNPKAFLFATKCTYPPLYLLWNIEYKACQLFI